MGQLVASQIGFPDEFFSIVAAARILGQSSNTIAGSGLPIIASILASELNERHLTIFDSGSVGHCSGQLPVSVSDGLVDFDFDGNGASILAGALQTGRIKSCVIGAAQIDAAGKINSSRIEASSTWRQLPGPGGAPSLVTYAGTVVLLTSHDRRRFPYACDFVSSDPVSREFFLGRRRSVFVVTEKCVLKWNFSKKCFEALYLLQPKSLIEDLRDIPFLTDLQSLECDAPPTDIEVAKLRQLLGPKSKRWNVDGRTSSKIKEKENG